ncbi:hypothetical protein [Bacillus sp. SG-1]|uniref:hypothetical protein n=1 Tax=Bacillus sp. SG-1 TaxID=161544 RepID=UPI0001543393|nr:hypothetical protein [Bacillus sp. SG-1]EDL66679.1 hypothetical protein BSG1_04965 [Bacillus sp. SG-1]
MLRIKTISIPLILTLILIGCQDSNLNLNNDVTVIHVYKWDTEELIATIDDEEIIEDLVKELDNASTHSTETIDWQLPDYKLLLKQDSEVLYEIGYCKDIQNFGNGAVGRYWEFDKLYEVSTKLPIE